MAEPAPKDKAQNTPKPGARDKPKPAPADAAQKAHDDQVKALQRRAEIAKERAVAEQAEAKVGWRGALAGLPANTLVTDAKTTVGTGGGNAEATLLTAEAVARAAMRIGAALNGKREKNGPVLILSGQQKLSVARWRAFEADAKLVQEALEKADAARKAAKKVSKAAVPQPHLALRGIQAEIPGMQTPGDTRALAAAVLGAGAVIGGLTQAAAPLLGAAAEVAAKIGSYLLTEYSIFGATVSGVEDGLLAMNVAGTIPNAYCPGIWMGVSSLGPVSDIMKPLIELRIEAAKHEATATGDVKAAYVDAIAAYDKLVANLAKQDGDGVPAAVQIADEKRIADLLAEDESIVLFVKLNSSAGGYYTKKNLWTSIIGRMPLYVMGSAVVTWLALDGKKGTVIGSGQVALHSGYRLLDKIADEFGWAETATTA